MGEGGGQLRSVSTPIPGLIVLEIPVHGDNRGWFKENWQRQKMAAVGLPDFGPVQNNISFNEQVGTTRGIHAEPWDKFVSVATGRVFGAWVDLREGPMFGEVFTCELDASRAVYVPRGVGNAFQTLEPHTAYTYLVNEHWSADASYTSLNLADPSVAIDWPIPLHRAELSTKDAAHPQLADVVPMPPRKTLVVGANGQLGRALRARWGEGSHVEYAGRGDLDLTDPNVGSSRNWADYGTIVNASAYTGVDAAETPEGRREAWDVNVAGVGTLARLAAAHGSTFVQISSDYVFDGNASEPYREEDPVCPIGVYGQTKAAADAIVRVSPRHYILRTSWVIGDGTNFVRTMQSLAERGIDPSVVGDQVGRLTFTDQIAAAISHLLDVQAPYGVYNVTGAGVPRSWADIARDVFRLTGQDPERITEVTSAEYAARVHSATAPRPAYSVLSLEKIKASGYTPDDSDIMLARYLASNVQRGKDEGPVR